MNVLESLQKARDLVRQIPGYNEQVLDFLYQSLKPEAEDLDNKPETEIAKEAKNISLTFDHFYEHSCGKQNIFASKIMIQVCEKIEPLVQKEMFVYYVLLVFGFDNQEIIHRRDYYLSQEGIREIIKLWE